jgi:hypothetical protein
MDNREAILANAVGREYIAEPFWLGGFRQIVC